MALFGPRRRFVDGGTLDTLLARIDGLTSVQSEPIILAESGKWAQATGSVINASRNQDSVNVSILIQRSGHADHQLFLMFDRDNAGALILAKEDIVTVQGKISGPLFGDISLRECEIISHSSAADLRLKGLLAALSEVPDAFVEESHGQNSRSQSTSSDALPPLSEAALQAWYQAFKVAYPTGSKELAEKSATGAFPNHHVARSRVRELFPNVRRGRPKKSIA